MRKLDKILAISSLFIAGGDSMPEGKSILPMQNTFRFYGDPTKSHSDNVKRKFKIKQSRHSRQKNRN